MAHSLARPGGAYALIHLVAQEADKDLIGPQVLDNAAAQLDRSGPHAPAVVAAAFLEPLRHAASGRIRARMRVHAARHPGVRTALLPYVSRFGPRHNARALARQLRKIAGPRPVVLHCRGESAVRWATAFAPHFSLCGIVADIRGAWPEEMLFARGFDRREDADAESRAMYDGALANLRQAVDAAGAVSSVSPGMLEWLEAVGVPRSKMAYVPCCVAGSTFDDDERARMRARLGLGDRLVFCYLGTITRYQHVPDGVLPFFRALAREAPDAHLLCITPSAEAMAVLAEAAGIARHRVTIVSAAQREVPAYLSAVDAGFLLRAPSRLNRVSQPTKLAEYLAAGVPVIVARGTGQVDEVIDRERAGAVVTAFGLTEEELDREAREVSQAVRRDGPIWRDNALGLCHREFVWSAYTQAQRDMYVRALRHAMGTIPEMERTS